MEMRRANAGNIFDFYLGSCCSFSTEGDRCGTDAEEEQFDPWAAAAVRMGGREARRRFVHRDLRYSGK